SSFAVDSSGFSTCRFEKWVRHKYGKPIEGERHSWVKAHLMCGVKTNVVTSVEISDAGDAPTFPTLVKATGRNFHIDEVSGDKAYSSIANLETVAALGGFPYIPFKSSATGESGGLWAKMFHYFSFRREEFLQHYHKRSNIESTFA